MAGAGATLAQRAATWLLAAVLPALLPLSAVVVHETLAQGERQVARLGHVFE